MVRPRDPALGLDPLGILPFPNGKDLLMATGNDSTLGSTTLALYRVKLATRVGFALDDWVCVCAREATLKARDKQIAGMTATA